MSSGHGGPDGVRAGRGPAPPSRAGAEFSKTALDRMVFFSDAVFAIAITLLVLPLADARLPQAGLTGALLGLWPKVFAFVLSFLVIGNYWIAHHNSFDVVVALDGRLLQLNLLFLLCIAFLPFPTAVLGEHGGSKPAVVLYAGTIVLTGIAKTGTWCYATHHHRLVDPRLDPRFIRSVTLNSLVAPAIFLPSIPVAFLSEQAAEYVWILAFPLGSLMHWLFREARPTLRPDAETA